MTEIRPRRCMAPEIQPVPSIVDYRPKSTLVVAEHPVKRPKYPVIDYHGHPGDLLASPDAVGRLVASLDSLNIRVMIAANKHVR